MLSGWSCKAILHRGTLLAALAGPFVAEPAWAQGMPPRDHAYRLDLVRGPGAEECPSGLALAEEMRGELRRTTVDPLGDLPTVGRVKVEIAREGSSWRVSFSGWNREGYPFERMDAVFEEERCEQIWPKVATMAARMIEVPLVEKEVPPLPPPEPVAVVVPPGPPPWQWRFGGGVELGSGMLPVMRPGLRLEAGGRQGSFVGLAELRLILPTEVLGPQGGRYRSLTGGFVFGGCLQWRMLGGCALVAPGWLNVEGLSFLRKMRDIAPYLGMGVRAFLEAPLPSSMALRLEGDFVPTVTGVRVMANMTEVLWTMPWCTVGGALKLIHTF